MRPIWWRQALSLPPSSNGGQRLAGIMAGYTDKDIIRHWLRLHNRLKGETYQVESWPDEDSSKKNVDALCRDTEGRTLAIEHTLIEPYPGHKEDTVRFLKTLATLENHPGLVQKGYLVMVSQPVGAIPRGIQWDEVPREMLVQLAPILAGWRGEGSRNVTVNGRKWSLDLHLSKMATAPGDSGSFLTSRIYPGDPGPEIILAALEKKIPKLAAAPADKRILLLEKDAVSGNVEAQFEQLPEEPRVQAWLSSIDEIWTVNTAGLDREDVIFTNQILPPLYDHANFCSLELTTDKFWQVSR